MTRCIPHVVGWKLDQAQRNDLLERFPQRYRDAVADHVTLRTGDEMEPLPDPIAGMIVGHADDDDSLEALVVAIDGTTNRPDGSTFHITWSLDRSKGRTAKESNDLLRSGWMPIDPPIVLRLDPARF